MRARQVNRWKTTIDKTKVKEQGGGGESGAHLAGNSGAVRIGCGSRDDGDFDTWVHAFKVLLRSSSDCVKCCCE